MPTSTPGTHVDVVQHALVVDVEQREASGCLKEAEQAHCGGLVTCNQVSQRRGHKGVCRCLGAEQTHCTARDRRRRVEIVNTLLGMRTHEGDSVR